VGKLIVRRELFDEVIADHVRQNLGDDYDFYTQATEHLEIRKLPQIGGELDTVYVDFGNSGNSVRAFAEMYGVPKDQIVIARNFEKLRGLRARLKPINMDYYWSLLNWNHMIHQQARIAIYRAETQYGSVDASITALPAFTPTPFPPTHLTKNKVG
jgi:hypothetical protein